MFQQVQMLPLIFPNLFTHLIIELLKGESLGEEASSPAPPITPSTTGTGPRQSGSLVTHHDDVITRMKNLQMIELGRHRIKPWYFSPYPQV